jgi:hypothetical protein
MGRIASGLALKTGESGFYFRQVCSSSQWRFYKPNKIRRDRVRRGCAARRGAKKQSSGPLSGPYPGRRISPAYPCLSLLIPLGYGPEPKLYGREVGRRLMILE